MDPLHRRMLARLPSTAARRWYDIRNAAGPTATVRIYGEIGFWGVTAEDFAAELDRIDADEIEVQISSPGGSVFDSIAIYNALRTHSATITTRVDGIAASGASVIAQAGDRRVMLTASQIMIHEAWGIAVGPASDMREMADLLDRQTAVIAGIYASRSGRDLKEIEDLLASGTDKWFSDAEAVEAGLADEIFDPTGNQADDEPETDEEPETDDEDEAADDPQTSLTEQRFRELLDEALAKFPLAGEREDTTTPAGAVDPEQAGRLLSTLTLSKEQNP